MKSFLHYAGSKQKVIYKLLSFMPKKFSRFIDAFFGSGAVFINVNSETMLINDLNWELVNVFKVVKEKPNELIKTMENYFMEHHRKEESYYKIRGWDRLDGFRDRADIELAGRTIYLNKNCFNSLYRTNKKGEFNVPFQSLRMGDKILYEKDTILLVSKILQKCEIFNQDFEIFCDKNARANDLIYFDPPYHPISKTSSFTNYINTFDYQEQLRLKNLFDKLNKRGCFLIQSNSYCPEIVELYNNYTICTIESRRNINSKTSGRKSVQESIITNYSL